MKGLELLGLALLAGLVAWAIYGSVTWSEQRQIAAAWLSFPAGAAVVLTLVGVHAAGIRAFFPIAPMADAQKLVTGSKAVGMGLGFTVVILIVGAFWGLFAWGIYTANWSILEPATHVIGVVVGVGVVVAVLSELRRRFFRGR
jgi:hypothetical protein